MWAAASAPEAPEKRTGEKEMKQKHGREMEIGKEEERGKEGRERKVESFRPPPSLSLFPLPRRNPHHAAESPSFAPRPPRSRGNDACASVRSGIATSSEMPLNANGIGFCFLPVSFFSKKNKKKTPSFDRLCSFWKGLCSLSLAFSPHSP